MGMSVSQSRCHWAGEKGPDSKRKRIFSPTCSFENTTFFKDHGACINMIPCEFGAHGAEGEGRVSRVLKWSPQPPHGSWEAAMEAILPKDVLSSSPRSYIFFNPQSDVMGTTVVRVAGSIWAESCEPEMSVYGAESAKSAIAWPHMTATQAKFWAAECGTPYAYCLPGWENGLHLYCLAARKFSKSAGWCYPHLPESHPQSTKQRAAFLLSLSNELGDAFTQHQQGCPSGQ